MNQAIENQLKKISIRGRMAIGIKCLETYLEDLKIDKEKEIQKLLSELWEFISSESLDKWEEKITEYEPMCIREVFELENYGEYNFLSIEEINRYHEIYTKKGNQLEEMISYVIEIGTSNLFAGTEKYSKPSLNSTIEVLEIMQKNNLSIPDLAKFAKSKYSEFHGWGLKREKSFFD